MEFLEVVGKYYFPWVSLVDVGRSYENRHLKTIVISNSDGRNGKNVILLDAGLHAREWITPAVALYVVDQLLGEFEENAHLLKDYDWIILPLANPDGYEYSRNADKMWRNTRSPNTEDCFGTNLNRNFDVHWSKGYIEMLDPCSEHYAGSKPFSEIEAIAIRDLMLDLVRTGQGKMYLSLHSHNESIYYPWVYEGIQRKNHQDLHEIADHGAKAMQGAYQTDFKARQGHQYGTIGGTSLDYAYKIGIPLPFVLELSGREHGFFPPPEYIETLVKESWAGIRAMAEKAIEKYPLNDQTNQQQQQDKSAASSLLSTSIYIIIVCVVQFVLI
ncbi:carboxypeptidase B1 [Drosophila tropicalis]|uniref:carboxypeptidase B1 n=1 Tax=Drosophila tropicalis TaxID=46794 RepID=UPI0035AC09D5